MEVLIMTDALKDERSVFKAISKQNHSDLAENETILLSECDRNLVMSALENPLEPNEALKELFINT